MGDGALICSWNLSANVLPDSPMHFSSVYPTTLISVNHSTFLKYVISVFGVDQEIFDSIASSKIHLYAMLAADVFAALTQTFHIGYHNVRFVLLTVSGRHVVVLASVVILLPNVCPVQSPIWMSTIL